MDSIKIRVWDFDDKRMIYLDSLIQIVYSGYGNFKLVIGSPFHDDYWRGSVSHYGLMQWTGLQDKKGKDVYEGDVVTGRVHRLFDNVEETKVVSYDALRAVFVPFGCVVNYDGQTWIESVQDFDGFSVIGNVYAHPELLEQIKESK